MKKKPPFNQEMAIRGANRRLFARSPFVVEKMSESRREVPRYKKDGTRAKKDWVMRECEVCHQWVSSSKISVDHIDPVVPPEGFPAHFDMWDRINMFLRRLWCDKSNLQRICDPCHNAKTQGERIARLLKQYTQELDEFERDIRVTGGLRNMIGAATDGYKDWIKLANKYIAKKKTKGLEPIVERAKKIKEQLLERKKGFDNG